MLPLPVGREASAGDGVHKLTQQAIWLIEVEDFPAFILVGDKGNDFFAQFQRRAA